MSAPAVFFYLFGAAAVLSALGMVLNVRNTVAAALCLVITMISLAVTYVVLDAHLVAALQIMVYAGAIVVVFLFVVMARAKGCGSSQSVHRNGTGSSRLRVAFQLEAERLYPNVGDALLLIELDEDRRVLHHGEVRFVWGQYVESTAERPSLELGLTSYL